MFYTIQTFHGTRFLFEQTTGRVCHGVVARRDSDFRHLLAWVPKARTNVCFLFPSTSAAFELRLEADQTLLEAIALRLSWMEDGTVALAHPSSGYLCAEATEAKHGMVAANRTEIGLWEKFTFVPESRVPKRAVAMARKLELMLEETRTAPQALENLKSTTFNSSARRLLPSILRLLQPHELEWLGRALVQDKVACDAFASLFEDDVWAQEALPGLLAANSITDPAPTFVRAIGTSLDHLAWAGMDCEYASLAHMCNAFARRTQMPTRDLCLLTTARNEGLYFLEWIAYHRALGVEAFFIYTNNNDDGSDDLLAALVRAGIVNWIRNRTKAGVSPQYKAYGHAFQVLPEILHYRWVGVIDLDEFIVLDNKKYKSIPDFTADREVQRTDAIALSWLMFGSDGETRRTGLPVTRRFLSREPEVHPNIKSLCRPGRFIQSHCHFPIWDRYSAWTFRNASGDLHPQVREADGSAFSPSPKDECAWINHYCDKSAEEFILRRAFSSGDSLALKPSGKFFTGAVARSFIEHRTSERMVIDRRGVDCVPDLDAEIEKLRRLPGVDEAMVRIEASYRKRLRDLDAVLRSDPRFRIPNSPEKWFADVVAKGAASRRAAAAK